MMEVSPRHAVRLEHEARHLAVTADRARVALAASSGQLTVLDGALRPVHRGGLPAEAGPIALGPSGDRIAVASPEALVVAHLPGAVLDRREHRRWEDYEGGAVGFLGDGSQVLAVLPREEDEAVTVALLRPGERGAVAEATIEVPERSGFQLIPTPDPALWALWAGAGQDGQWTYWVRVEAGRISVQEVEALSTVGHGPIEPDPSGRELLVVTDDGLERFALPAMRRIARIEPPEDLVFSESCCWLGGERALVTDVEGARLFVVDLAAQAIVDEVRVAGHEPRTAAKVRGLTGADADSLCTDLWWLRSLPRSAALAVFGRPQAPQMLVLLEGSPLFSAPTASIA